MMVIHEMKNCCTLGQNVVQYIRTFALLNCKQNFYEILFFISYHPKKIKYIGTSITTLFQF